MKYFATVISLPVQCEMLFKNLNKCKCKLKKRLNRREISIRLVKKLHNRPYILCWGLYLATIYKHFLMLISVRTPRNIGCNFVRSHVLLTLNLDWIKVARRRSNQFTVTEFSTNSVKRLAAAADVVRNSKYESQKRSR